MWDVVIQSCWELCDLIGSRELMGGSLSEEEIKDRYELVGGIPRYIFQSKAEIDVTLRNQKVAINTLTEEQITKLTFDKIDSTQTFKSGEPKSVIMVYKCPNNNFADYTVAVASRNVAKILVETKIELLWNTIVNQSGTRGSTAWQLFEIYCQRRMTKEYSTQYFEVKFHDGTRLTVLDGSLQLGNCTSIKATSTSLIDAAKQWGNENVLFYSLDSRYPLYDFIYRENKTLFAFQVTTGEDHTCTPSQLKAAVEENGDDYEFLLHYLTFDEQYKNFKLKPVNPFKGGKNGLAVKSVLTNNWTIKVIRMISPNERSEGPQNVWTK